MSSTISAGTTAGSSLAMAGDTSGSLQLQTNGTTTAVTIDTSQNVGIGTSSPANRLDVASALCAVNITSTTTTNYVKMQLNNAGGSFQLGIENSTGGNFGAPAYSRVLWNDGAYPTVFYTNSTERMRLDTSGNLLFNSGYGSVATAYGCRAWVNFNGTGTVAIRASGNVSSITDNGTGDYTVNFTTAMPDANYQINTSTGVLNTGSGGVAGVFTSATVPTASLCRFYSIGNASDAHADTAYFYVSIFR